MSFEFEDSKVGTYSPQRMYYEQPQSSMTRLLTKFGVKQENVNHILAGILIVCISLTIVVLIIMPNTKTTEEPPPQSVINSMQLSAPATTPPLP